MSTKTIYAEDVNYWKSSTSSMDTWIDKAKKELATVGGKVTGEMYGAMDGKTGIMLSFELSGEQYKVMWPVLKSKTNNEKAAKIQAATALYHDIKARCVAQKFLGDRAAFMPFLMLPNGVTVGEATSSELAERMPYGLLSQPRQTLLTDTVTIERDDE